MFKIVVTDQNSEYVSLLCSVEIPSTGRFMVPGAVRIDGSQAQPTKALPTGKETMKILKLYVIQEVY